MKSLDPFLATNMIEVAPPAECLTAAPLALASRQTVSPLEAVVSMNPHDYVWGMNGVGMMPMTSAPWSCSLWGCMPCPSESSACALQHMQLHCSKHSCQLPECSHGSNHGQGTAVHLPLRSSVQSHLLLRRHTLRLHAVACLSGVSQNPLHCPATTVLYSRRPIAGCRGELAACDSLLVRTDGTLVMLSARAQPTAAKLAALHTSTQHQPGLQ